MSVLGYVQAAGQMTVTTKERWCLCRLVYDTFDPRLVVDRNKLILSCSDHEVRSWKHHSVICFEIQFSTCAEAWAMELTNRLLLGTTW